MSQHPPACRNNHGGMQLLEVCGQPVDFGLIALPRDDGQESALDQMGMYVINLYICPKCNYLELCDRHFHKQEDQTPDTLPSETNP